MLKPFRLLILTLLVGAAGCAPTAAGPTITVVTEAPTAAVSAPANAPSVTAGFDAAQAMENEKTLAVTIGKRVAGTPGNDAAADFIEKELTGYGYKVTRQPFPFEMWEEGTTSVKISGANAPTLAPHAIRYSPGGTVDGEVAAVPGLGNRDDFSKANVRGKIVLVERGTIPFSDKAMNAEQAGATAILIYNNAKGTFDGTLRDRVKIPVLALSGEEGEALVSALKSGSVQAHVEATSGITNKNGHNLIATRPGATDETIVIGGHYDTVEAGPGAGDNGSGTAVIMELARVMAQRDTQHTLVFIGFDAEEEGLIGSRAYVEGLSDAELGKIRAMLNFDMLGGGTGPLLLGGDGAVALLARSSAKELGIDARNFQLGSGSGSDHESFQRRGLDTVFFSRQYDLLHTPQDTIDQIKPGYLDEAGKVAVRLLERLDANVTQ